MTAPRTPKELAEDARLLPKTVSHVTSVCPCCSLGTSECSARGKEIKREITARSVALDLPKDHDLRVKMQKHEVNLKEQLETCLSMKVCVLCPINT